MDAQAEPEARSAEVDAIVRVAQVAMAVVAQSLATVEPSVSQPQLRILVLMAARSSMNIAAVAEALGVHPSNATRACDGLVKSGLLDRRTDEDDRRHVHLSLSDEGRRLVNRVLHHRRKAFEEVVATMSAEDRLLLAPAFNAFADAAGELPRDDGHLLLWMS